MNSPKPISTLMSFRTGGLDVYIPVCTFYLRLYSTFELSPNFHARDRIQSAWYALVAHEPLVFALTG